MQDQYGRTIDYLRVSITDRCNLRCRYCMPTDIPQVSMSDILTYEEICEICETAAGLGIRKIKITGGEPLVRLGCAELIGSLKKLPGIEQVTMTTNGVLLAEHLSALLAAGLDAVNVSLDTLERERFAAITGRDELASVLEGIDAALRSPLRVKINVVPQRGVNDGEWVALARLARERPLDVRFIEMMPIGYGKDVAGVPNREVYDELLRCYPRIKADLSVHGNGPAVYCRIPGWQGSIGFISAIHGKFCESCNRVRLTSKGRIKPCLCYGDTTDLMPILRGDADVPARRARLRGAMEAAIYAKPKQHCFEELEQITETARMASIGG